MADNMEYFSQVSGPQIDEAVTRTLKYLQAQGSNLYLGAQPEKSLMVDGEGNAFTKGGSYTVLSTGNKPSSFYFGTGSEEERVIETGGIGSWCGVQGGASEAAIVCPFGAFYRNGNDVLFTPDITCIEGVLSIKTASIINTNGFQYLYAML